VAEGWTTCHEYPQLQYAADNPLRTMPAVSTHILRWVNQFTIWIRAFTGYPV